MKRGRPIDILLPLEQPAAATRAITALKPLNFWTIFGVVVKVLQLGRVRRAEEVEQELVTGGHTLTLTQIEALICEAETGQDVGLITNGKMNFFFVQTQHSSVPTVAVFGRRLSRGWEVNVSMFGYGHRWDGDARVVLCNLDPGKVAAATVTIQ